MRFTRLSVPLIALFAASALLGACDDQPLFPDLQITTDTVTVAVPGGTAASAIDLARAQAPFTLLRRPELVQDAGQWDIALRRTDAGGLSFRPYEQPGTSLRGAGIQPTTESYEGITRAPRGTTAYGTDPAPVTVNAVYKLRSRQYATPGGLCVHYAKAKVLAVDAAAGTAQVALVINDNCDDERLEDD